MSIIKVILIGAVSTYIFFGIVIYFIQESLIFFPEVLGERYQYRFESNFVERNFQVSEDVTINSIHFKSDTSKGVIFYHHGNAGSLARWGEIGEYFVQYGYDVLIYDYRGFGKSTGKRTMKDLYGDGQFLYSELMKEYPQEKIIVYGRSLGSGIAVRVAADNDPGMLILETPYYSLSDVAVRHYPIFPHKYLLKYPFPSFRHIRKVPCPVFVLHGTRDHIVDYESGYRLFQHAKGSIDIEMITIQDGGHNDLMEYDLYQSTLKRILLDSDL